MALSDPNGVICISGPTAAGKTALAMALYDTLNCELVSVDSALVYKGMDIGTAKPAPDEQARYPHHLIDVCDPAEAYSANHFRRDALQCIEGIFRRGKTPLLVGGTMLYYKALLGGLSELPGASADVREHIQQRADQLGWAALHDELNQIDPTAAERIHPNDPQRLMRALEVYELTGKSLTELTKNQRPGLNYPTWQIAVAPEDRKVLHARIEQRFDLMLEHGFEHEVRGLYERGDLHADLPSMRSVGYRQMWQYFEGELSWEQMRERGIIATRQLAKRQITWLRSWPGLHWLHPEPAAPSAELQNNLLNSALKVLEKPALSPQVWV